ncbi:TetR/AcrR family transcriptional regulator [Nocardioides sp. ChNu-153]|uniref:TetR/AcrR family transcriptional regulator n=1 Tax=unclassified Nocardioides TaxID=2615069 RepID=UPI0024050BAA|nr:MULTISPECIES: TetR/AcrR family transcriptional regulator [unclassified Nocardioides]MDF9715991.1 TetR/AcrR family transcriptional regulator [Nocardioides sp. ChNu-99]MDN7119959.1 TetR/AcrR family transcriptional regulator [Nocardioides sp. ChNu-153]
MSRPEAQRADGRRSREAILAAAERLLLSGEGLSVSGLAREAGLTRATFYRHFRGVDAVLDALTRSIADALLPSLLDDMADLALDAALARLAHEVVALAGAYGHVLARHPRPIDELARLVVPDEPIAALLGERRSRGELTARLSVDWLARCVRASCLVAITDERDPAVVADELALTLQRLVAPDAAPAGPRSADPPVRGGAG